LKGKTLYFTAELTPADARHSSRCRRWIRDDAVRVLRQWLAHRAGGGTDVIVDHVGAVHGRDSRRSTFTEH
jgi:hypothetical protein